MIIWLKMNIQKKYCGKASTILIKQKKLKDEIIDLKGKIAQNYNFEKIVGKSDAIKKNISIIRKSH